MPFPRALDLMMSKPEPFVPVLVLLVLLGLLVVGLMVAAAVRAVAS